MVLQSKVINPLPEIETIPAGTRFWQIYQGRTLTGFGQVSRIWEIVEYMGGGVYKCKPISDNTTGKLNLDYRESFTEEEIKRIMKETPIVNIYSKTLKYEKIRSHSLY